MRFSVGITSLKEYAERTKKSYDDTGYAVLHVNVSYGDTQPTLVVITCPVPHEDLCVYQAELARSGIRLSLSQLLEWGFLAQSSLDIYPVARTLMKIHNADLSTMIPVIADVIAELGSELRISFNTGCQEVRRVLAYDNGDIILEVAYVIPVSIRDFAGVGF